MIFFFFVYDISLSTLPLATYIIPFLPLVLLTLKLASALHLEEYPPGQ